MLSVATVRFGRLRWAVLAAALWCGAGFAPAQSAFSPIQNAGDVTFPLLATAPFRPGYQMQRVRRFLDDQGQVVQVREKLTLQGSGSVDSPFKLEFLDMVGPGSAFDQTARSKWVEVYRNHEGLLHFHGGFCVHDAALAAQNYRLYDFGQAQRIGRTIRRVVVFPNQLDKGIWVLDVDTQTGIPLYSAEYDANLRLLNELESTSLTLTGLAMEMRGPLASPSKPGWSWKPRMLVTRYASVPVAAASLTGLSPIQPAIASIVGDYTQNFVQVSEDPVNGDRTLVVGYTDGIDEFFVLQTESSTNPFANSPAMNVVSPGGQAHAIASYDDPALRAYVFHENGVTFRVVGRGSLLRLKDVARRLCQQAVTGV